MAGVGGGKFIGGCYFESGATTTTVHSQDSPAYWTSGDRTLKFVPHDLLMADDGGIGAPPPFACSGQLPRRCVMSCAAAAAAAAGDGSSFIPSTPDLGGGPPPPSSSASTFVGERGGNSGNKSSTVGGGDVTSFLTGGGGTRNDFVGRGPLAANARHQHTYEFPTCL